MSCLGTIGLYRCDACGRVVVAAAGGYDLIDPTRAKLVGWSQPLQIIGVADVMRLTGLDLGTLSSEPALRPRGDVERWRISYDNSRMLCPDHPDEPGIGLPPVETTP